MRRRHEERKSRSPEEFDTTSWGTSATRKTLIDISTDAFLLIFHIHAGNDPGHPDELRKDIALLLKDLDGQAKRAGYHEEDIKATRYALCALIDETILNSRWEFKDQWADRTLQLEYFGEHMAGERFFDLLDRVRKKGSRKVDLLEVFCVSLIVGFQGKFKLRGKEELDQVIRQLAGEIHSHRGGSSVLSPHWRIPDEPVAQQARTIPRWFIITGVVSVALVILFYIGFKLVLRSDVGEAVSRMVF